ncbi:LysR substrate-binding domain-containing protein [Kozakia baliensis]|uniref:LysR substrate-binding domain-containing protein n=1 Tax=Kozakia baliensis TaxID=153496 RepID=UPI001F281B22|nr:LysR substrate-binding domain-containing protein [Kozakia baliensis]
MPALFGKRLVAPILFSASQNYKNLKFELYFDDNAPDILTGRFDIAIRSGFSSLRQGFASQHLTNYPMVVCCSPSLTKRYAVTDLVQLKDIDGLFYNRSGQVRPWRFPKEDGRTLEIIPQCRLILNDIEADNFGAHGHLACKALRISTPVAEIQNALPPDTGKRGCASQNISADLPVRSALITGDVHQNFPFKLPLHER